jgi:sugar O-acyltransferase (sialic acid O-acetyltransferase NeuD family)
MNENLIIIGASTAAESIYKIVMHHHLFNIIGFAVDKDQRNKDNFCGMPVFNIEDIGEKIHFDKKKDLLFVAIQWNYLNKIRRNVYERLKNEGFRFANIISPYALIYGNIKGDNCWISDFVVIDTDSYVGNNVYIKTKAYIAHNSIILDHCFIGANSFIAGYVEIGEQSYVGISSNIFDEVKIGQKCLIGACTIVKRHLPDFSIIKTDTSRQIVQQSDSHEIENKLVSAKNIR